MTEIASLPIIQSHRLIGMTMIWRLFIVGDEDGSAVHSEPPIDQERLFFSILPGNQIEIEELYLRWHP